HLISSKSDKINRKFICRMVRSSFEVADFFIDEPIFLRNMRIFKKKSVKFRGKSALPNLMCSALLRLRTFFFKAKVARDKTAARRLFQDAFCGSCVFRPQNGRYGGENTRAPFFLCGTPPREGCDFFIKCRARKDFFKIPLTATPSV
ncbi:MAG: hypothetical protein IJZ24_01920, partial [Clostridia bacterium]|nr:hypothetical protein [Clostridia bacterium]